MSKLILSVIFNILLFYSLESSKVSEIISKIHYLNLETVSTPALEKDLFTAVYNPNFIEKHWCKFNNPVSKDLYSFFASEAVELLERRLKYADSLSGREKEYFIENIVKADSDTFSQLTELYKGTHPAC